MIDYLIVWCFNTIIFSATAYAVLKVVEKMLDIYERLEDDSE